jgi:hypothetical protein
MSALISLSSVSTVREALSEVLNAPDEQWALIARMVRSVERAGGRVICEAIAAHAGPELAVVPDPPPGPICLLCGEPLENPEKNDAVCPKCDAKYYGPTYGDNVEAHFDGPEDPE